MPIRARFISMPWPRSGFSSQLRKKPWPQWTLAMARAILRRAVRAIPAARTCPCSRALRDAIITARDRIPPATRERLKLLVGKYL